MTLPKPRNIKELCYPFIYDHDLKCDYEIHVDELCCQVGMVLAYLPEEFDDVLADLNHLHPLIYHLNGSVRGKNGIFEEDIAWMTERYDHYNALTQGRINRFVLPQGPMPVPALHMCRTQAKKTVRYLVKLDEAGEAVEPTLPRFANLLANFFFVLTVYLKMRMNVEEKEYISINY